MKRRTPEARTTARAGEKDAGATACLRTRSFILVVSVALLLCAFVKVPTLLYPRTEGDEAIYWQLAQNLAHNQAYSLQGTPILAALSPGVYDHPLFHHPPLFAALLAPFALLGLDRAAITVSWLGHLLAVLAVALVSRQALASCDRRGPGGFCSPAFWLPLLAVSVDPLLLFVSRKIWIDSLLAGLVALSVAVLIVAQGSQRRTLLLVVSGSLLGLAGLAKLSALVVAPVHFLTVILHGTRWRSRMTSLTAVFVPVALLVLPWCVLFYLRCGVWVPTWVKPDAWLIEHAPFVKVAVSRPWYYYLAKFPLVAPLICVCIVQLAADRSMRHDQRAQIAIGWFVVVLLAITVASTGGYGFQMRHVAPVATAPYVLMSVALAQRDRPGFLLAYASVIVFGAVTGAMFLLLPGVHEMLSLPEIARIVTFP